MNGIIARIDLILSSDGWKRTAMLQILRDELVEKRDAALKAKETYVNQDEKGINKEVIVEKEDLVSQGKELVEEYFPEEV